MVMRLLYVCLFFYVVHSSPPANPVNCHFGNTNCTVTNSYGAYPDRGICKASMVSYPSTEMDILNIVPKAAKAKQKIRVFTQYSHSMTKLACVDGYDGQLISTRFLNRTININKEAMTITVQSGVSLRQLIKDAADLGLALRMEPQWWGLTVGGMMSTGAHGSTWFGDGTAFHDSVIRMRVVTPASQEQGYAMIRLLNDTNFGELDGFKVSLGVLGVISEVTIQLENMFKRSITYVKLKDLNIAESIEKLGRDFEFADVMWHPSKNQIVYRMDKRVPLDIYGNGSYDSLMFTSRPSKELAHLRSLEEALESQKDSKYICTEASKKRDTLYSLAYGLKNDGTKFDGYPVIGYHSDLMSSGSCLHSKEDGLARVCPWDSRVKGQFFQKTTFTLPIKKVKNFLNDINDLLKIEPNALCRLESYNGVMIRYLQPSVAPLGNEFYGVQFEFTYYRSRDPLIPRVYGDFMEEIEQIGLFKYGGLPHWAKNRNIAFIGVMDKYKYADMFLELKLMFDPLGLFSNEWTDKILALNGSVTTDKEGCALEGLCICSKDIHCAPTKGYFCRSGKVYKAARVCTFLEI